MKLEIQKFNQYFIEFIQDLKYICNQQQIVKLKKGLNYLKYNHKVVIDLFKKHIADNDVYRLMIMEQGEYFFLNHQFQEVPETLNIIIVEIKEKWMSLNSEEKTKIWNYLKVLLYYCDLSNQIDTKEYHTLLKNKYMRCLS